MSVLASDNFNRADGGLGANWTAMTVFGGPSIVSNRIEGSGTRRFSVWSALTWPNDQYSQVVVPIYTGAVVVRGKNAGGESDLYFFQQRNDNDIDLYEYLNNVGFTLLATDNISIGANPVLYLEAVGSALTAKINGSQVLATTDATFATGSAGVGHGNVGGDVVDDWEGGDLVVVAGVPRGILQKSVRLRPAVFAPGIAR